MRADKCKIQRRHIHAIGDNSYLLNVLTSSAKSCKFKVTDNGDNYDDDDDNDDDDNDDDDDN